MKAYRQGELLFVPREVKDMEELEKLLSEKKRTTVIAEGEATGHRHELANPESAVVIECEPWNVRIDGHYPRLNNFEKILHTESGTTIIHQDHEDLVLPEGTYFIKSQREYDEAENRAVVD